MTAVHLLVPAGVDDPARPSGGNVYDRRISSGLTAAGHALTEHHCGGDWPHPDEESLRLLAKELQTVDDDLPVIVDGLIASAAAEILTGQAARLRLVVLVHMPLGTGVPDVDVHAAADRERTVLACARAVVTTSSWARQQLLDAYALDPARVHVAHPGADPAPATVGTDAGGRLLCVAALTPHKSQHVLLDALADLSDLDWHCTVAGARRDLDYSGQLYRQAVRSMIAGRVTFTGALPAAEVARLYADTDLLVLPSRGESYGMVLTEALARAVPVVATAAGGTAEALGTPLPGCLVPTGDPTALGRAVRDWLTDPAVRRDWRAAAAQRRTSLTGWDVTVAEWTRVLDGVSA